MNADSDSGSAEERQFVVMRHAKSDWGDASLSDHDRPLNERGCRDAPRMAAWMADQNLVPDLILSSSSQRTRQTVILMCSVWGQEPQVEYLESLYLATPDAMLRAAQSAGPEIGRVMVLAHNPGVSYLASSLAGRSVDMPTAAVAVFRVKLTDWKHLHGDVDAELLQYMRPKAL